ncbi:hypothetical protein F4678DRAFT_466818 [Xylaria arbuscula]|nr:hypothetical protein F4678DRAFT_466818 [Xylaria arbuscula]
MVVPSDRISFASFEDDQFISAYSSQPDSRLMSVVAPHGHDQEVEQLPEHLNSTVRPSEPLTSVCQLSTEVPLSEEAMAASGASTDKLTSSPAPVITTRRWSSVTGREQGLSACHYQGRLPTVGREQCHGHISKQGLDGIVCNVRAFLAARRQNGRTGIMSTVATNENDIPLSPAQTALDQTHLQLPALPDDQYLITTDDITGILDIVIASVSNIQDERIQTDCRSRLFPNATHVKPTLRTQDIVPGMSAIADPATTICSPQPCFSSATNSENKGQVSPTPKTTYISRQSITEINWELLSDSLLRNDADGSVTETVDSKPESPELPNCVPIHNSQNRHLSWPQSRRVVQRGSFGINPFRKISNPFEERFRQPGQRSTSEPYCQRVPRDVSRYVAPMTPITSFPRLISRSCTNDWLTPLGLFDDVENGESAERREMVVDFYNDGIDAHCGIGLYNPLPILEEDSQSNSTPPPQTHLEDCQLHIHDEDQWPSVAGDGEEDYKKNLGSSIGVACHQRIRFKSPHDQHQHESGTPLNGLRRYSFLPLLDHTPKHTRQTRQVRPSLTERPHEEHSRKRSSRELLQQILHRSNSSSLNSLGSKSGQWEENMVGSQKSKVRGELERAPCSEDTTPHICVDEQRTE